MPFLLVAVAVSLIVLLGWIGGGSQPLDVNVIAWWAGWRAANPETTGALIGFTTLGGATVLLLVGASAAAWLWWRGRARDALTLAATVLTGRLAIEAAKLLVDRPRPTIDAHPVAVFSQSFPSAHSGNSMITYCALALWLMPERWRRQALAGAIGLALAIGATRPMLGVHWPSDVLGGWLLGAAVVTLAWRLRGRAESAA